jgi:hypothetical protein
MGAWIVGVRLAISGGATGPLGGCNQFREAKVTGGSADGGGTSTSDNPPSPILLGRLLITPGALAALQRAGTDPVSLLVRHGQRDWGDVCEEDRRLNNLAAAQGSRLLSVYTIAGKETVWIITEADRSATTMLLPEEY